MKEILKQSSVLFFAQIATRFIGFFYTIFLARSLGVLDFGLFSVGLAYFSIISSLSDFGFNRFLIREISKDVSKFWQLLWNILIIRLTLICVFFALFSVILYLLDQDRARVNIILLSFLAVFPQVIAVTFEGLFIALRKLQFSSIAIMISSFATVIGGFLLVSTGLGTYGAISALIFGQIVYALVLVLILYFKQGISLSEVTASIIKKAILGSLPYGLLGILGLLYFRVDTIMLSYMRGNFETGIYSAAYKFLEALVFIPNALSFAIFPIFSKLHENDPLRIKKLLLKSIKVMFFLGSAIALIFFILLPIVIKIFLPNYSQAIDVIKILSLAIPFMFIHIPAAQVLLSSEKYLKQVILLSMIPLLFNVILNLNLIPKFGFIGASWVTVASDILSTVLLLILIRKLIFKYG